MSDEQIISKIVHCAFWNDPEALLKSLWRQTHGNRAEAYEVIRGTMEHHGFTPEQIEDFHMDCAMARLNGGVEMEWVTLKKEERNESNIRNISREENDDWSSVRVSK